MQKRVPLFPLACRKALKGTFWKTWQIYISLYGFLNCGVAVLEVIQAGEAN